MLPKWLRFGANVSAETPQTSAQSPQSIEENDAKYESQLLALLQEVEQGATAGNIQGFLIAKSPNPDQLAQWLRQKQAEWTAQPEQHRALGRNLWQLSRLTKGALAAVAAEIGQQLVGELNQAEDRLVDPTISSIEPNDNEALSNNSPHPNQESALNQSDSAEQPKLQDQAEAWFEQGNQKGKAGDFYGAIESYNQALHYKTDDHLAWSNKGNALFDLGRYEEAVESYNQALHYKPDYPPAWYNKGLALHNLGRYEEAIESYNQALHYKSDAYLAWNSKGIALSELERYEEAIESYNQALHHKTGYYESWYNKGAVLKNLGRYEEAIESYNQALHHKPDYHLAWDGKGLALSNLGRYEEAIESYNQALHHKPDYHLAWNSKGIALSNLGRYEEAIESYNQALHHKPDYHLAWNSKGIALSELGLHEEAIESYNQALHYKTDFYDAWNNKGATLSKLGRYEEAIESCSQALHYKTDYHGTWSNKGLSLYYLGRYEEAIESYNQALHYKTDAYDVWSNKGTALSELGLHEEAIESYNQALYYKPNYHNAWDGQGISLYYLGRYEEAIESYNQVLHHKPDAHDVWSNKGAALSELGLHEEAIESYNQALHYKPDFYLVWNNKGNALNYLGRYKEAIESYNQALHYKPELYNVWNGKGAALSELGLHEEAIESYNQALHYKPNFHNAWVNRSFAALNSIGRGKPLLETTLYLVDRHPELTRRGYEGQIASLQTGLRYVEKDSEGWGDLHRGLGNAHYQRGRLSENPHPYWRQAVPHYNTALRTLTIDRFPKLRLETLQALIRVLYGLKDTAAAQNLQREGSELLRRMLAELQHNPLSAQQLVTQFANFNQISVDLAVQAGQITEALKLAEDSKNTCLRWMLGLPEPPDFSIDQIHPQLPSQTAILYWHLSPCALTTFLLLPGQPEPIAILPPQPDIPNQRPATLKQLIDWENWLSDWNRDYQDYSPKKDQVNFASEQRHKPWRTQMADRLATLGQILQIDAIQEHLRLHEIDQLILVPHRDLHCFPLHIYFDCPCTYLPSLYFGLDRNLNLSDQTIEPLERLLLIENPKSDQVVPLSGVFMEIESALLQTELPAQVIANREADAETMLAAIQQPHPILHFSGHAEYNSQNPARSRLCLAGMDELTLQTLSGLDLSHYQLVCLAACETGVTGNQTITEEYVGLVSAFLAVGADRVVSTLWTVEAAASAYLIVEFYRQLRTGASVSQALYHAQNQLKTADRPTIDQWLSSAISALPSRALRKPLQQAQQSIASSEVEFPYADPYYWAPFFVSGL